MVNFLEGRGCTITNSRTLQCLKESKQQNGLQGGLSKPKGYTGPFLGNVTGISRRELNPWRQPKKYSTHYLKASFLYAESTSKWLSPFVCHYKPSPIDS